MPQTKAIITIQNVVASGTLNQRVDLNAVAKSYPNVEYRPKLFPGLVFRLKRPKTATLIFSTGKMVYTGAKSVLIGTFIHMQYADRMITFLSPYSGI